MLSLDGVHWLLHLPELLLLQRFHIHNTVRDTHWRLVQLGIYEWFILISLWKSNVSLVGRSSLWQVRSAIPHSYYRVYYLHLIFLIFPNPTFLSGLVTPQVVSQNDFPSPLSQVNVGPVERRDWREDRVSGWADWLVSLNVEVSGYSGDIRLSKLDSDPVIFAYLITFAFAAGSNLYNFSILIVLFSTC